MELFSNTNIDFLKYRRPFAVVSGLVVVATLVLVVGRGHLNLGIDFAGGTQLTVLFAEDQEAETLRRLVRGAGIEDATVQRFGLGEDREFLIRTPIVEGEEEGSRDRIEATLHGVFNDGADGFDVNREGTDALADFLHQRDPDQLRGADETLARTHYGDVASAILEVRRQQGLIGSWDEIASGAVSDEVRETLRQDARLGSFAVLGAENVGPQIGAELRNRGILAVVLSLIGMLLYIWLRFELRFGIGALVATLHDVLVLLGLFALLGYEFNLTTIAAFLTLVGYSVNDTVVVFDRVRENLRLSRRDSLEEVMNKSLNQTLSRTVLTSGTTLLTVGCLYFLGGDVLRGFGFILTVGILVGTYSSIYIASPYVLWWENLFGQAAKMRREAKG